MTEAEQIQLFIRAARRLRGMRFLSGAQAVGGMIDCANVPVVAAKRIGYLPKDFRLPHYPPSVDPSMWDNVCPQLMDEVLKPSPETVREGDVVILYEHFPPESVDTPYPRHCGILVANGEGFQWLGINFAAHDNAFVTEVPFHKKLWDRIYKVYRLRPPTDGT